MAADCNGNGIKDWCDVSCANPGCAPPDCEGSIDDNCNNNLVPDSCEPDVDCNTNSIRDLCELGVSVPDCNGNGVPDSCDIVPGGFSADCDCEGTPDECQICAGTSPDVNNNWIPDECATPSVKCCLVGEGCTLTTTVACCTALGGFVVTKCQLCPLAPAP